MDDPRVNELMASLKQLSGKEMKDMIEVAANADKLIEFLKAIKNQRSPQTVPDHDSDWVTYVDATN